MYYNVSVKMALMKTVGFQCESKKRDGDGESPFASSGN